MDLRRRVLNLTVFAILIMTIAGFAAVTQSMLLVLLVFIVYIIGVFLI